MTIGEELKKRINTYKKNKTAVSPEDLNGKYKSAFEKLKNELKSEIENYLWEIIFSDIPKDVPKEIFDRIQSDIDSQKVGRKAGRAIFIYFDFEELSSIALEEKQRVDKIYERGMDERTG